MRVARIVLSLAAALLALSPLRAGAGPVVTENVTAALVAETLTVRPGERLRLGLKFDIRDGWHIYWRNPGDSGLPPVVDWTVPDGVSVGDLEFPIPERIPVGPLMNFGYHGTVLFPIAVDLPPDLPADAPLLLQARADWLVCEEVCIPESGQLSLVLPVSADPPAADPDHRGDFAAARALLPQPSPWPARFAVAADAVILTVAVPQAEAAALRPVGFFPYAEGAIEHAAEQRFEGLGEGRGEGLSLRLLPGYQAQTEGGPLELDGVLVLEGGGRPGPWGVELRPVREGTVPAAAAGSVAPPDTAGTAAGGPADAAPRIDAGAPEGSTTLAAALAFALLGGLLLNLMPCVFPVLFLKALTFVEGAREAPWRVRRHGLVFTLGVLVAFAAVAGALLALLAGGAQIGWGFQLQEPTFVALLALLFFAIGLNLSGVYGVGGHGVANLGAGLAARGGYAGSFFTGVLATVVATPCTAPFMGAATGFALTQPAAVGLGVFLALGFGMALPWLVLSFSPPLLRLLPRPGAWMARFKQALAFPMYAAAGWLLWVLSQQAGPAGLAAVLTAAVTLGFALWLAEATRSAGRAWRGVGIAVLVASVALAIGLARMPDADLPPPGSARAAPAGAGGLQYAAEAYAAERLDAARAAGRPVFLNFTAAWCITCLVNERVVLATEPVQRRFAEAGVVYLKGDWTRHDPAITAALNRFGRSGVPLYVVYRPGEREPQVLPQILSETAVLAALQGL